MWGPTYAKKISLVSLLYITGTGWTVDTSQCGTVLSCVYVKFWPNYPNITGEIETYYTSKHFPILFCLVLVNYSLFPVLTWQEMHPVWPSTAAVYLVQGLKVRFRITCNEWLFELLLLSYPILLWTLVSKKLPKKHANKENKHIDTAFLGHFLFFRS